MKKLLCVLLLAAAAAHAQEETRDPAQVRAFRKANACPATGKVQSTCAGWVVNHITPLCYGGQDAPANMEWEQKAPSLKRDVFERKLCAATKKATASK